MAYAGLALVACRHGHLITGIVVALCHSHIRHLLLLGRLALAHRILGSHPDAAQFHPPPSARQFKVDGLSAARAVYMLERGRC
jgi:hypothetical protein